MASNIIQQLKSTTFFSHLQRRYMSSLLDIRWWCLLSCWLGSRYRFWYGFWSPLFRSTLLTSFQNLLLHVVLYDHVWPMFWMAWAHTLLPKNYSENCRSHLGVPMRAALSASSMSIPSTSLLPSGFKPRRTTSNKCGGVPFKGSISKCSWELQCRSTATQSPQISTNIKTKIMRRKRPCLNGNLKLLSSRCLTIQAVDKIWAN